MSKLVLSVFGLAVVLALNCAVDGQVPPSKRGAQAKKAAAPARPIRPARVLYAKGVKRSKAVRPNASVGDQLTYTNVGVNARNGFALTDTNGQRLRASQIRVWAPRVAWQASPTGPFLSTPSGEGGSAPSNFRYPGFHTHGIVVTQPGFTTENVESSDRAHAQVFQVSNGADIIVNVNDDVNFYLDNSGAFDLVVEILQL